MVRTIEEMLAEGSDMIPEAGPVEGNPYALNENFTFIDSDTISQNDNPNWRGRIAGVEAPEVNKFFSNRIVDGTPGGRVANAALMNLARKKGFVNVIKTGKFDGNKTSLYPKGREIIDLQDDLGRSFQTELARADVLDINSYSSPDAVRASQLADIYGTEGIGEEYDVARDAITKAIQDETNYELQFKEQAVDEIQLAYGGGYYAPGNVMYRDPSRTLSNKATSPFATAWDSGLWGAVEGLYGAVEMLGETTGWNWAEQIGEAGIARQRDYLAKQPEFINTYKDLDGFFGRNGFLQYVANMGAISLPYMAVTMAGMAAAPFTKGTSLIAPVSLYAGNIWNEQPEDAKSATAAVAGGVLQTALDRLGVQLILKNLTGTAGMLTAADKTKIINAIKKKKKVSGPVAEQMLLQSSRKAIAEFSTDAAMFAKQQITARNVARSMTKKVGLGAVGEGSTEAMQEVVGYTAAHVKNGFRDWDANIFVDRLIDGTIAGASLGGAFSAPGSIYDYGMWYDAAHRKSMSTGQHTSKMGALAEQDRAARKDGRQHNVQEENELIDAEAKESSIVLDQLKVKLFNARGARKQRIQNEINALERSALDINDRSNAHEQELKKRGAPQWFQDMWKGIPGLWRGITRHASPEDLQLRSKTLSLWADGIDANLQRRTSGETYEDRKHHKISKINQFFGDPTSILAKFNMTDSRDSRQKFSKMFYLVFSHAFQNANKRGAKADGDGSVIDWKKDLRKNAVPVFKDRKATKEEIAELRNAIAILGQNPTALSAFSKTLDRTSNRLHEMQKKHNTKLGYLNHYLSRSKTFDKAAIAADKGKFESLLIQHYGFTPNKAKETTEAILNQSGINSIWDVGDVGSFSVTSKAKFTPKNHQERTLGLAENPAFSEFMEGDIFTNVSNNAKSAIRYTVLEEFVGADNKKINLRLAKIERELMDSGMTAKEASDATNKYAYDMKNYFDAESGNYKRNMSPAMVWAQKNLLFVTMITSLPFATVSNMVEIGTSLRGLRIDQIWGKEGSLNALARSFVEEIHNTARRFYGTATGTVMPHKRDTKGYKRAQELGYMSWEVGAAHTTGVSETGVTRQRIIDIYFKTILLQQWTNAMRAGRAAIAGDYIVDKLATIVEHRKRVAKDPVTMPTNEEAEAREALRNLGIDPDWMAELHLKRRKLKDHRTGEVLGPGQLTKEEEAKYSDFMRNAEYAFVNEAVVMPKSGIRPLIFQDPRFALFTQFQGFISTFTAYHLPKMWGDLGRRGTPAMRYNLFAAAATMILLGFASQHLKDLLKYGKTTPYFEGSEYIRRGFGASGLMGTGERVVDFFFPMYQKRYPSNIAWAFGTVAGESAGLSKALRAGGIGWDVASGQKPPETLAKISPLAQFALQKSPRLSDLDEPSYWDFGGYKQGRPRQQGWTALEENQWL
tara:strand:+ start:182 stop:4438 length:4257 start_codon:yes stop_codon:yes gene_type:complete